MNSDGTVTLRVKEATYLRLQPVKHALERKAGKQVIWDSVIEHLLDSPRKEK